MKMRKLLLIALGSLLLASCKQEEIVYDHELPQFEIRNDAILLEFIAPTGTAVDDEIFIYGAFNGMDENTVLTDIQWKLEKATQSDQKWGIYLYPKDFAKGKSLMDGFTFVSKKAGAERDIEGKPVSHTLDVTVGTRTNIWAERWASYFAGGDQTRHDGVVVYVFDESGFENLCLYLYGEVDNLNGTWPGMKPTGTETINGVEFTYFDLGEDNTGLSETFIFNDNGSNQLADYGPVVIEEDLYLHITADGNVVPYSSTEPKDEKDGARVYVLDGVGWGMSTTLYLYGEVNNLNGGWPGMKVKGTTTIGEYIYLYYDMGAANEGLKENLIFSQSGKDQLKDYTDYTIGEDLYLYISTAGVEKIEDPEHPGDKTWFDPSPSEASIDIYFYNATETVPLTHVYAYGSSEAFGGWPGTAFTQMDSLMVFGIKLYHFTVPCHKNDVFNLIVNDSKGSNDGGAQLNDYVISATEDENELYLKVSDDNLAPLEMTVKAPLKK